MEARRRSSTGERGQAVPLVLLVLAFAIAVCGAIARAGNLIAQREHARHAADATALAGAIGGEAGARTVAEANRAALVTFEVDGDRVTVRVRHARFTATARAERVIALAGE
jgi:hypothetical protein